MAGAAAPRVPGTRDDESVPAAHELRTLIVEGIVQGVGFRPFVYRLAKELDLAGRVRNTAGRVEIDVAGPPARLAEFTLRLRSDAPPRARVERISVGEPPLEGSRPRPGDGFRIEESRAASSAERLFPPDIATCDECLRELFDPHDRRYRYPFINCTNCGPRATIIEGLPYDRAATSMRDFPLCPACASEYGDPSNRRFHAEPVACPICGPRLAYQRPGDAAPPDFGEAALQAALHDLRLGRIVAIKGLGGYHLACDATDARAVLRLRDRKRRWAKPFAVMVRDLATARHMAHVSREEARLLCSPERPIVLLRLRDRRAAPASPAATPLAGAVCNGDLRIGLFLPYTPLHHLLLEAIGRPIVLTSGNLSDEPLATDDADALERLSGLADAFLRHDREIRARYDDSVTRVVRGSPSIVRRARGYAPDPLPLPVAVGTPLLATGAELKHTFTLARRARAHVAPHTGDLEDLLTHRAFEENLAHLTRLLDLEPEIAVHDGHPGYLSTQFAVRRFPSGRRINVQHHHAHVASCAAEHGLAGPVIGVAYDGLGMGDDGTLWGGEILIADLAGYRRFARFGLAPLPGGALAVRRPYRMALGYLFGAETDGAPALDDHAAIGGAPKTGGVAAGRGVGTWWTDELADPFLARLDPQEVRIVRTQLTRRLNAPLASSAGRLFDAVSSLLGIRDVVEYEAQAAADLETAAGRWDGQAVRALPYRIRRDDGLLVYDPRPTLAALLEGLSSGIPTGALAAAFHETVALVTRELCDAARRATGIGTVCLSGGVFQNQRLAEAMLRRLARDGFDARINRQVPVNDGGISYGQAAVAAARLAGLQSGVPDGTGQDGGR